MIAQLLLSAAFGVPFGIGLYIMYRAMGIDIGLTTTVFAMTGTTILSWVFFLLYKKGMDKRYSQAEAQIPCPIFHKSNGNFDLGGGRIKNGNIYFCNVGIVCVSMEEKPYALDEITVQEIHRISFDTIHMHIYTKDSRLFKITLPDAAEVAELLIERDWVE